MIMNILNPFNLTLLLIPIKFIITKINIQNYSNLT